MFRARAKQYEIRYQPARRYKPNRQFNSRIHSFQKKYLGFNADIVQSKRTLHGTDVDMHGASGQRQRE